MAFETILTGFGLNAIKPKFYGFTSEEEDPLGGLYYSELFGTPVFSNLVIPAGSYKNNKGEQINYEAIRIDAVLFDVSQSRNIVKTEMQGVNGTVKEYISDGDYQINIKGVITSTSSVKYPDEEVKKLIEILKVQKALDVESRYLNDIFNIHYMVIEGYSINQNEGIQNSQFFSISAISDDPIELTIREK